MALSSSLLTQLYLYIHHRTYNIISLPPPTSSDKPYLSFLMTFSHQTNLARGYPSTTFNSTEIIQSF